MKQPSRVSYKTQLFVLYLFLEQDDFTSVIFINQGLDNVRVLKDILIEPEKQFAFINEKELTIDQQFPIEFAGGGSSQQPESKDDLSGANRHGRDPGGNQRSLR